MRLVPSNGYIYCFHDRNVGITRRFISLPRCREVRFTRQFIIIIITTAPIDVEGCEVGHPTVYDGYMVRYIVGF